jgi:hypothetical protein
MGSTHGLFIYRLMKKIHLLRYPHLSSLRRTSMYVSFLRISGALHLDIFDQPAKIMFFNKLILNEWRK